MTNSKDLVSTEQNAMMNFEKFNEIFKEMENLEPAPIAETASFLSLAEGETLRVMYLGITQKVSTKGMTAGVLVDTAMFVTQAGDKVLTMNKVLVENCIELNFAQFTPLQIDRLANGTSKEGNTYFNYRIKRLVAKK